MAIHPAALLVLVLSPLLVACVDDIAFWPSNGHYYQWVQLNNSMSYSQAQTLASSKSHNSKSGYVVTIGSLAEQQFLASYLSQITLTTVPGYNDYPNIWGGATRNANSWVWVAAGRVSNSFFDVGSLTCYGYCNWADNSSAAFPTSNGYMQILLNNNGGPPAGTWRTAPSSAFSPALVVEYDASQTCDPGFIYQTQQGWCVDVNECTNNPKICGKGYQCINLIGSYECDDINECLNNATICNPGYYCSNTLGGYQCLDINECAEVPSVCSAGYQCQNYPGSYQCTDINECTNNATLCGKGYVCHNTPGSYSCDDINECTLPTNPCPFGTKCQNTIGSYTCDSIYYQIQSVWNQLYLDFVVVNGVCRVITAYQTNQTSQLWSFDPEGFVVNANNGYVMDAEGGLVYPGVFCILWPRKPLDQATNQLWSYNSTASTWSSASNPDVLDIYHAQYSPGAQICLFTPKSTTDTPQGNLNQRWNLVESNQTP